MSKKKEKRKWKSKENKVVPFKSKTKPVSLKARLDKVYTQVNLETTCQGSCACCKVAMPQLNYCEFIQLLNKIWNKETLTYKIDTICTAIEYFFKHDFEKWGMESLVKPCMFVEEDGTCRNYSDRPLSCRLYGLWPEDEYNRRVDKFEKAYEGLLTREELPLNTQCPNVKRVDDSEELTIEIINSLYAILDRLDLRMQRFTESQVKNKENYRAFHDWFLYIFFGEEWLSTMTVFITGADKSAMEDQLEQIKIVIRQKFAKGMPDIISDKDTMI
jgi:Fe-S-cluster containining protein